jgi:hypothetical protein
MPKEWADELLVAKDEQETTKITAAFVQELSVKINDLIESLIVYFLCIWSKILIKSVTD